jgi:carboxymethylenebutenolidase
MTQRNVKIDTSDGTCPAALSLPDAEGPWPAVIMFADAGGMRDTIRQMGERLSGLGYVVLVPDFYYRNGPYEPVDIAMARCPSCFRSENGAISAASRQRTGACAI